MYLISTYFLSQSSKHFHPNLLRLIQLCPSSHSNSSFSSQPYPSHPNLVLVIPTLSFSSQPCPLFQPCPSHPNLVFLISTLFISTLFISSQSSLFHPNLLLFNPNISFSTQTYPFHPILLLLISKISFSLNHVLLIPTQSFSSQTFFISTISSSQPSPHPNLLLIPTLFSFQPSSHFNLVLIPALSSTQPSMKPNILILIPTLSFFIPILSFFILFPTFVFQLSYSNLLIQIFISY